MARGRDGGRGRGDGRAGRDGRGGAGRSGRGAGYSSASKTVKYGLCKELEGHVFEYSGQGAADKMRVTMEKIQQFVGLKFGKDVPTNSRIEPRWFYHRLSTPLLSRQGTWCTNK